MISPATALTFLAGCFVALFGPVANAQSSLPPLPSTEFEVASIRMVDVDAHSLEDLQRGIGLGSVSAFPANLFTANYMPLSVIISIAYGIDGSRITGKPDWLDSQLWQISAKVEGNAMLPVEQMRPLLQTLLRQRFHLTTYHESRSVPGYTLVVAKGGFRLQASKEGDKQFFYILPNGMEGHGASMKTFAGMLESPAGRPVIDHSGIAGTYDIKLSYATVNRPDSNLPDLFTALGEQLGLKLGSQKVPVDMLVIDHVDRTPTDN